MVDQILIDILAYGHVLSAIAWLGGGILTTFVLGPNLRSLSPGAGLEFNAKVLPKIVRFVQGAIGSTLVFGILLFYVVADQLTPDQTNEIYGGVALALVTAVVVFAVTLPSFRKVIGMADQAIKSGQPPSPEMMKYGKRARMGSLIGVALLLVVLLPMIASGFS
jgi:uncharacterized membrane protein